VRWVPAFVLALVGLAVFVAWNTPDFSSRRGEVEGRPTPVESDLALRGRTAYMLHCDRCHPGGAAGLGPALNNRWLPSLWVRFQVRTGLGSMPSFSDERVPSADLDALIEYLDALRDT
jgi:mono/diheme cytochrome c family protein